MKNILKKILNSKKTKKVVKKKTKAIKKVIKPKKISKVKKVTKEPSKKKATKDTKKKINEQSSTKPNSIHGKMHLQREKILKKYFKNHFCIIRPTLVYGPGDTHKGYGPNKFINLALKKKEILLFGNGEERRDHIYIDDLIHILYKCILRNAVGIVNAITGKLISFLEIAKLTKMMKKFFHFSQLVRRQDYFNLKVLE